MVTKFRTLQTLEPSKGQTFDKTKDVFRLNKATNELEKTEEKFDLQAAIDSCLEMALNRVFERLMPQVEEDLQVAEYRTMSDDIDELVRVQNIAEEYRDRYKLPDDYSIEQIFAVVDKKAGEIYQKLFKKGGNGDEVPEEAPSDEERK